MSIEKEIQRNLEKKGYKVLRNGWPDFLVEDSEGNVFFMEVKNYKDRFLSSQKRMLKHLANLNFHVFVVAKTNQKIQNREKDGIKIKLYDWKNDFKEIDEKETLFELLLRIEKEVINKALKAHNYNHIKTADYLGITYRQLRYHISKTNI